MAKTVVITGATWGIGRAVALAYAKPGANVAISGRREEQGKQAALDIKVAGGKAFFPATDVHQQARSSASSMLLPTHSGRSIG